MIETETVWNAIKVLLFLAACGIVATPFVYWGEKVAKRFGI